MSKKLTVPAEGRPPRTNHKRTWTFRRIGLRILLVFVGVLIISAFLPTTRWADGVGFVMTDEEAEICPSVQGAIEKSFVETGSEVRKGQLLIQLVDGVQRAAFEQAKNELDVAKARLSHMQNSQKLQEAQRKEQIFRANKNLQLAKDELRGMSESTGGAFSKRELAEAKLNVDFAESKLTELKLPRDQIDAQQIEVLREEIAAAAKKVALYQAEVDLRKIRSPIAGVISFNNYEAGEVVKPEYVLGQVFDNSAWIVKLKLPEKLIPYVEVGQPVEVELSSYPAWRCGFFHAKVSKVLPIVTPQSTGDGIFYVEAKLDDPSDKRLSPGLTARGRIDTGRISWLRRILGW